MSRTPSPFLQKPYSLVRICRMWRLGRSNVYWQRLPRPQSATRPGPLGSGADEDLVHHIRTILAASPFMAKDTARSGPGCAMPGSGPRKGACRG